LCEAHLPFERVQEVKVADISHVLDVNEENEGPKCKMDVRI
jgi:hypothetical protein